MAFSPMRILVLNAGSGSQKCSLFEIPPETPPAEPGEPSWEATLDSTEPGQPPGKILLKVRQSGKSVVAGEVGKDTPVAERTRSLLQLLTGGPAPACSSVSEIGAVGHRVVHGGDKFDAAVRIDAKVEKTIEDLAALSPLHNPNNLVGVRVGREVLGPQVPAYAVFDTAFHRVLPEAAFAYAGPYEWLGQGIRRYGFHGSSYRWASRRAAQLLGRDGDSDLRLILCHLGGGCSLCATRGGRSIDTTMGFTPLDGIAMCTRSGAIDPGILIYLLRHGVGVDDLEHMLNKESGLQGLSGATSDTRVLLPAVKAGDRRAKLAWDVFIHRLRAGIGAMLAALGEPPHAIVFTDAIGEDEPSVRSAACAAFGFLGVELDEKKNADSPLDADLATPKSQVRVLLIKSGEARQIALETSVLVTA